jgi:hypothetical protein
MLPSTEECLNGEVSVRQKQPRQKNVQFCGFEDEEVGASQDRSQALSKARNVYNDSDQAHNVPQKSLSWEDFNMQTNHFQSEKLFSDSSSEQSEEPAEPLQLSLNPTPFEAQQQRGKRPHGPHHVSHVTLGCIQHMRQPEFPPPPQERRVVILMEPTGEDEQAKATFLGSDVKVCRALEQSTYGKIGIEDIHKNYSKGILVVTMKKVTKTQLTELLNVSLIGNWNVQCKLPRSETFKYGVIGPFGKYTTNEEIKECLLERGYQNPEAVRLLKKSQNEGLIKTAMFKIGLEVDQLPTHVFIGFRRCPVRPYTERAWQCFNCQEFGHNAAGCSRKKKCVICSGAHSYKECITKKNKCSNCGQGHTASYGGCKYMRTEKMVQSIRAAQQMSYREAVTQVKENTMQTSAYNVNLPRIAQSNANRTAIQQLQQTRTVPLATSITFDKINLTKGPTKQGVMVLREIATQTETNTVSEHSGMAPEMGASAIDSAEEDSSCIPRWAAFMIQVLTINDIVSTEDKTEALVKSLQKILGISASYKQVEQFLTPHSANNSQKDKGNSEGKQANRTMISRSGGQPPVGFQSAKPPSTRIQTSRPAAEKPPVAAGRGKKIIGSGATVLTFMKCQN